MNIFDLLFLAVVLATLVALGTSAGFALARRGTRSLRILRHLAACVALYLTVVIFVSLLSPRREYNLGDTQCFDDWCIAATSYSMPINPSGDAHVINLRISSRARRVSQRERNIVAYLTGRDNHRYDPVARPSDIPFDTLLEAGKSVELTRFFRVSPSDRDVNLVIAHEGGFPIGWFIIGYDTWFRKPPLVRLHKAVPL